MSNKKSPKKHSSVGSDASTPEASTPQISAATFPALREFLRGYLHQDWPDEYSTPAEAARDFCQDASPQERTTVKDQWEAFRQQTKNLSLPAISSLLSKQLGADWSPQNTDQFDAISAVFREFAQEI